MLLEKVLGRVTEPHRLSKLEKFKSIKRKYPSDQIYVHYTIYNKLGVNPKSKFKTPIGIYAYPLEYLIDIGGNPPFAQNRPYIIVFKVKDNSNIWHMSPSKLTISNDRLNKVGLKIDDFSNDSEVWNTIRANSINQKKRKPGIMFRHYLNKMGVSGATDLDETSWIIADMEPIQAVFFDISKLETIDVIENKKEISEIDKAIKALSKSIKRKGKRLNNNTEEWILNSLSDYFDQSSIPNHDIDSKIGMLILYARRNVGTRWPELENFIRTYGSKKHLDMYYSSDYGIGS